MFGYKVTSRDGSSYFVTGKDAVIYRINEPVEPHLHCGALAVFATLADVDAFLQGDLSPVVWECEFLPCDAPHHARLYGASYGSSRTPTPAGTLFADRVMLTRRILPLYHGLYAGNPAYEQESSDVPSWLFHVRSYEQESSDVDA